MRALDQGYQWASTDALFAATPAASAIDGALLALPTQFTSSWEPEGGDFELRVHWRYSQDAYDPSDAAHEQLEAIAGAANSMPSIKSVNIKATVSPQILDASASR